MAGPTQAARREVLDRARERAILERKAKRSIQQVGRKIRLAAIRAWKAGDDPGEAVENEIAKMTPIIEDAMVAGHLQGRLRQLVKGATAKRADVALASPYTSAIISIEKQLKMPLFETESLSKLYGDESKLIVKETGIAVGDRLREVTKEAIAAQSTTQGGVAAMREALTKLGVAPSNPFILENMFRTQLQTAYSAGTWSANEAPEIQEILWGYEYVTVGDDRVRASHAALDGVRLPKDDPRWDEIFPPNGYNCRCEAIEIFKDQAIAKRKAPKKMATIDGMKVKPGADEGWAFNPGKVFGDDLAS